MRTIYLASTAANFAAIAVNCWVVYRNVQLRKREREALYLTLDQQMRKFAPAVGFCVLMRDMPGVPGELRQLAGESIPDCVEVVCTTDGLKIH